MGIVVCVSVFLEEEVNALAECCDSHIDISGNRKAVMVHVPYKLKKLFHKIHTKLCRELEKKFSGKAIDGEDGF